MAHLFLLVNDLFFSDRLSNGVRQAGHEATVADVSFGDSWSLPAHARLAIIDLEAGPPALQAIREAAARGIPVLAFGPHTDLDLRQKALDAGAERVVAKSKLTSSLAELIAEMEKRVRPMRIVIMGTGGTGGFYGAALARAGHDVTFVARGAHLEALRSNGLRITGQEEFQVHPVRAVADLQGHPPADVILFAVKTYDTDLAAELIRPAVGPGSMVLPVQNGVESLDRLDRLLGPARAVGGLCRISAEIAAPGVIKLNSTFKEVILGEPDGRESERTVAFAEALRAAGIPCQVTPDIQSEIWHKFAFITALSGVTGAARQPIGQIRACPDAFALFRDVVTEVVRVGAAAGVALPPDLPDALVRFAEGLPAGMKASLLVDLERGRMTEVESLQGALTRLGRRYGVPTPTTDVLYALIKLHQPEAQS